MVLRVRKLSESSFRSVFQVSRPLTKPDSLSFLTHSLNFKSFGILHLAFSELQDTEWLWNLVWLRLGNSVNEVLGPFSKLNDPKWNLIHSVCERQPLNSESFGIWHLVFCIQRSAFCKIPPTELKSFLSIWWNLMDL